MSERLFDFWVALVTSIVIIMRKLHTFLPVAFWFPAGTLRI